MIEAYHFGSITIDGRRYQADIKIVDGRVVTDRWRQQAHVLNVFDVDDILVAAPEILIVGMGQPGMMRVAETLRATLVASGTSLLRNLPPKRYNPSTDYALKASESQPHFI